MKFNMKVECSLLNNIVVENILKIIIDKKIKILKVSSYKTQYLTLNKFPEKLNVQRGCT